ncbi:MAG: MotA/TolQ/ExbB proton channel family protein [Phormidesmis sp.]
MELSELFRQGGIAMWPLLFLSILALGTVMERIWFWSKILTREREVAGRVLESARREWTTATQIAQAANRLPMGRFLFSALKLKDPAPEVFKLALETSASEELAIMRRGEKVLEAVIAIAPLLGLLGTVVGLINSLGSIDLNALGVGDATAGTALGIGEALISTAAGLIIAIISLAFYRIFQSFVFGQAKVLQLSGNELELLYRQAWAYTDGRPSSLSENLSNLPPSPIVDLPEASKPEPTPTPPPTF